MYLLNNKCPESVRFKTHRSGINPTSIDIDSVYAFRWWVKWVCGRVMIGWQPRCSDSRLTLGCHKAVVVHSIYTSTNKFLPQQLGRLGLDLAWVSTGLRGGLEDKSAWEILSELVRSFKKAQSFAMSALPAALIRLSCYNFPKASLAIPAIFVLVAASLLFHAPSSLMIAYPSNQYLMRL